MKKLLIPILFFLPFTALAVAPLSVQFENEPAPLFSVSNFMPGDSRDADITVGNNDTTPHATYIEAVNVSNGDNLASQMQLEIFDGATSIYNNNFATFLNAGPVLLATIEASGGSKTFNLKITFIENPNDDYQGKSLGFDICVGFAGGNQTCTNTVAVGPERNPDPSTSPGSSGGGGGSSSGTQHLIIYNETASNTQADGSIDQSGITTITWNTNIPATSQVIYGLASGVPYSFDINNGPNFGYPFVNTEDLTKKTDHSMVLTGLTPGETYVYRVISRASPATVSFEHKFTIPTYVAKGATTGSARSQGVRGEVLGVNTINTAGEELNEEEIETKIAKAFDTDNLAGVFANGERELFFYCLIIALLILLIAYIVWRMFLRKNR